MLDNQMTRTGVVTLLGAGAVADEGYPLASGLLSLFRDALSINEDKSRYVAPNSPHQFTQTDIFERFWSTYTSAETNATDYLEDFFAFYDDPRNIGRICSDDWGNQSKDFERNRLRELRDLAVDFAYKHLAPTARATVEYLQPLFNLESPLPYESAIASLNFDLALEKQAELANLALFDGFAKEPVDMPTEWHHEELGNLRRRWDHISEIGFDFVGFQDPPPNSHLLLKLHGSLGWFSLEEGSNKIGDDEQRRHNPIYRYFRTPHERWNEGISNIDQVLRVGEFGDGKMTRKAGAVWMTPRMAYASGYKAYPDPLNLAVFGTFAALLNRTKYILTIGYSWSDPHVNDLLFSAFAQGACLVHVGRKERPLNILRLWRNKLPTTFHYNGRRLFVFGGGAKRCFAEHELVLPTGCVKNCNLVEELKIGLPDDFSIATTFPDIDKLKDPPQLAQRVIYPSFPPTRS